jgi:hypothetical protein
MSIKSPGGAASLLRHLGLAQAGEIGGFEQGADFRHPEIEDRFKERDIRRIVAIQPAGSCEFHGGLFALALEAISGREKDMKAWVSWISA